MGRLHTNIQLMVAFFRPRVLVSHFFYYTLMTFLLRLSGLPLSMLILYSKCDQLSDLWQLRLASELESDLQGTVEWSIK